MESSVFSVSGSFVSQKISKIRWKPVPSDVVKRSDIFAAGSWHNEVNSVSLWQCPNLGFNSPPGQNDLSTESEPKQLCEIQHIGNVTDMKYINHELLAAGSSNGSVTLFKHTQNQMLQLQHMWQNAHRFRVNAASCTALDTHNEHLVSVGEDGKLIVYSVRQLQPLRVIDEADCCTITGVVYVNQNEVITSNTPGQLSVWDLRNPSDEPARLLSQSGEPEPVTCITRHPTQPSIIACGTDEGTLCIWELKQEKYPLTPLSAHDGPILELKFHPTAPNHLFTCSMDGKIWHWDSTTLANMQTSFHLKAKGELCSLSSPWLSCGASKHRLQIDSLIPSSGKPINSLDILDDILICGSDNEAIYVISNLKI